MSSTKSSDSARSQGPYALLTAGIAALLASTCCLGPLVLLMLGFSGAWIGNLTVLEPYRLVLAALALLALGFAARAIWRPVAVCQPGDVCARPAVARWYRWLCVATALLIVLALAAPALAPLFY
jgi:mercuric ion transport protein